MALNLTASLSQEVQESIVHVLDSNDPLDQADFDVVDFINSKFPDEESLEGLEPFIARLDKKNQDLDEEISRAIHEQNTSGRIANDEISEAKVAIEVCYRTCLMAHYWACTNHFHDFHTATI